MEYLYGALLIHKAGKDITDVALSKTLEVAGVKADAARVKATVAALKGVDIDKVLAETVVAAAPVAATPAASGEAAPAEEKKEEAPAEDEGKKEEEAAAGLGALFG